MVKNFEIFQKIDIKLRFFEHHDSNLFLNFDFNFFWKLWVKSMSFEVLIKIEICFKIVNKIGFFWLE